MLKPKANNVLIKTISSQLFLKLFEKYKIKIKEGLNYQADVRNVKSSLPLNLETNGFSCIVERQNFG